MSGKLTKLAVGALDAMAARFRRSSSLSLPPHLATGQRGEEAAYFHLRRLGYVMVARNFRSPRRRGEIDLIGWDDDVLCFIEVKSRSTHDVKPAEAAVDINKQKDVCAVAREYLRRSSSNRDGAWRFDVVSVYYENSAKTPHITLFKNAFSMS